MQFRKQTEQQLFDSLKAAYAALDANTAKEKKAGIRDETPTYLRLNQACADSEQAIRDAGYKLPSWARVPSSQR